MECPLLHRNKKNETDRKTEKQKNLLTMTSGGFVIVVTNNSLNDSK